MVLPALLDDCPIPLFLGPKRHADFRTDYATGLAQLALALGSESSSPRTCGYTERHSHHVEGVEPDEALAPRVASRSPVCYTQDTMSLADHLTEVTVELEFPYVGRIAGVWTPDEHEQDAAWELYVELVTRVSVVELSPGDGLLREGLSSLYSIFTTTRQILRQYGPDVARPKRDSQLSLGYLAISMLNYVLRPVVARWNPLLLDYEHRRAPDVSAWEHEVRWEHAADLRAALNQTRHILLDYIEILAEISGVPAPLPTP